MKDYIVFAIRINVALLLATILISAFVIPLIISALLVTGVIDSSLSVDPSKVDLITTITGIVSFVVVIFGAAYWVFKRTFGNTKKSKAVTLGKCILYSLIMKIIIDIAYLFFTNEINIIDYCASQIATLSAFYLAGRSVEKSLGTKQSQQPYASPTPTL